jgi:hypothetical protein
MNIKCGTCVWWDNEHASITFVPALKGQTLLGFCRKHKPIIYQDRTDGFFHGAWGVVDTNECCGEYRAKDVI